MLDFVAENSNLFLFNLMKLIVLVVLLGYLLLLFFIIELCLGYKAGTLRVNAQIYFHGIPLQLVDPID